MAISEISFIKGFLSRIAPERKSVYIEGQHKLLSLWEMWYAGRSDWHKTKVRKNGRVAPGRCKSSGIAKMIAEEWAANYANENTKITISKAEANNVIQSVLMKNKVFSKFGGFIEQVFALGIGATVVMPSAFITDEEGKIVRDERSTDVNVKISMLNAKRVIPITIEDGEVTECAFIRYATNKCTLQLHIIEDGYYRIYETSGWCQKGLYSFDYNNIVHIATTATEPLFQIWNPVVVDNTNLYNQVPCSIYVDTLDWFKCLDRMMDSFYKEFKNGEKKRLISTDLMYVDENGETRSLEFAEEEFYLPPGADGKALIQEFNGELRVDAFTKGINFVLNIISSKCGLGENKFEFDGTTGTVQTATGVIAKQNTLYKNIAKQENLATDRFKKMLMAIKFVNNEYTANPVLDYDELDITVEFDDNIVEDTDTKRKQDMSEVQAGIMSLVEFRVKWYDEDEKTATKMVQEKGLLFNQYLLILQAGAITPELFVDKVYGANVPDKDKLVEYISQRYAQPTGEDDYDDENDNPDELDEEDETSEDGDDE